jgi:hypothetical protein
MSLPMNAAPVFNLTVPSTDKVVKYRPFVIKEEKALLIAQQSEDPSVMLDTLKSVIKSCVRDDLDVDSLATFDIEYMFTQIRAKSVGEVIELIFDCDVDHGDQNEKAKTKLSIDLTKIKIDKPANHNKRIDLFGEVGVVMKYPSIDTIRRIQHADSDDLNEIFGVVADCIDYIFEGDEIHYGKEQKRAELIQFIESLTSEQFNKIQSFFETMPRLKHEVDYTCPICSKQHHKVLEGLNSFF